MTDQLREYLWWLYDNKRFGWEISEEQWEIIGRLLGADTDHNDNEWGERMSEEEHDKCTHKPEKNSVWMWGYSYEVPPSDVVYKTLEACEQAVHDAEGGEIPPWIWIREFEVVE